MNQAFLRNVPEDSLKVAQAQSRRGWRPKALSPLEEAGSSGALPMLKIGLDGVLDTFVVAVQVMQLVANLI